MGRRRKRSLRGAGGPYVTTTGAGDPAAGARRAATCRRKTAFTYLDVYVGRTFNVLASTDKPVYQPGQVIHIRGLALDTLDMHAADGMTMT